MRQKVVRPAAACGYAGAVKHDTNHDQGHDHGRSEYPATPDRRYFVVRGRLWRLSDPGLPPDERQRLVGQLMDARRRVGAALKAGDAAAEKDARAAVDAAKRSLGERGPAWWTDGAPDFNRHLVADSPYAAWHAALKQSP